MTEEEKKAAEDQKKDLNGGDKVYTQEDMDKAKQSFFDKDEGVQNLLKQSKISEAAHAEVVNISEKGKEYLVELHDENPKVAKYILDKYYKGQDIEEFKKAIGYKEDPTDPNVIEKLIDKKAKKLVNDQKINDAKAKFIKKLQMEGDELVKFEEAFLERLQLKSFNINDLDRQLERAYLDVNDDPETISKLRKQEVIGKTMATGGKKTGFGGGKKETSMDKKIKEVSAFKNKFKTS